TPLTGNSGAGRLVVAHFSNGDPDLNLTPIGNGLWSATWQPKTAGPVSFDVFAILRFPQGLQVGGQTPIVSGTIAPAGSALAVTPAALSLSVQAGASPTTATLAVTSTGAPISFTVSISGGAFLSVSNTSATTPSTITVSLDPSTLTAGSYSGSVLLNNSGSV